MQKHMLYLVCSKYELVVEKYPLKRILYYHEITFLFFSGLE